MKVESNEEHKEAVPVVEPVKQQHTTKPQKKTNAGDSAKMELLKWVQEKLVPYAGEFLVKDFTSSWQDGKALAALISTLKPRALKYKKIDFVNTTPLEINRESIRIAEEELDIPEIIDPEDITDSPEELSLMTYISYFRDYDRLHPEEQIEEEEVPEEPVVEIIEDIRPEIDPSKCIAEGPAFDESNPPIPGQPTHFTIVTYDEEGNKYIPKSTEDDENQITVNLFSPYVSEEIPEPDIKNNGDGTYDVSFVVPVGAKDLKALIVVNGESIQGTPHSVPNASIFDPAKSIVVGEGVQPYNLYVDEITDFVVECRDTNGANILQSVPDLQFDLVLKDTDTGNEYPVKAQQVDNADGTYTISYVPDCPSGSYELSVLTNKGEKVGNSPFDVTFQQKVMPAQCVAKGNGILPFGLKTGVATSFTIEINDKNGKIIPYADEEILVDILSGDELVEPSDYFLTVTNNQNGTYTVNYKPKKAGTHFISVKCNDENISQSPFKVEISTLPSAPNSKLKLVSVKSLPNLIEQEIDLKALDSFGVKTAKNCKLVALVEDDDGNLIPATIVPGEDDKLKVVFKPTKAGQKYKTKILMDGVPVGDSFTVQHKPILSCPLTRVFGPGLNGADLFSKDSVPAMFKIKSIDNNRNPYLQSNLQPIKASAKKLKRLAKSIFKEPDYFTDLLNPQYDLQLDDESVVESIDFSKSVDLDEVRPALERHIKATPFKVIVKNENTGEDIPAIVFNTAPAEYTVFYNPTTAGPISISVVDKKDQHPVADSPYQAFVTEGVNPMLCQVKGPALLKAYKGRPTYLTILPRDANNSPISVGGHEFYANLADNNGVSCIVPLTIVDNNNGTYDVKFTPQAKGKHLISIKHDGQDLKDSPFPIFVRDDEFAPYAKNCQVFDNPSKMKTTKPRHFFVQMKDKDNNPILSGGDPLKATLKTPEGKLVQHLAVIDPNTGKYKIPLNPKVPGKYIVTCSLGDEEDGGEVISGSPFHLNVTPGISPLKTEIGDWEFDIQTAQDNEPEDLFIKIKSPSGKVISPTIIKCPRPENHQPNDDDEYSKGDRFKLIIRTTEVEKGDYLIYANICGYPVKGSPFKQTLDVRC